MYRYLLSISAAALVACPSLVFANDDSTPTGAMESTVREPELSSARLTLEQAWRLADGSSIDLRQELARRSAVQGAATDARSLLWNNPKLSGERIRRDVPSLAGAGEQRREWTAALEQTFEIAGQQGYRRRVADSELAALDATIDETKRALRADVERLFVKVLSLQERIATESASQKIIADTAVSIGKRVSAGEDSRLDGNLAAVEAIRARNQIGVVQEQLIAARAELATILQLPPNVLPVVTGTLEAKQASIDLAQLQANAMARPLLTALAHREQAAKSRLSLERAARYPDVTVAVSTGREGPQSGRERLTGVSLSVPLPLFHRNASAIGRASTELTQAQIEREAMLRNTNANVASTWQKLQSLASRVAALQTEVLPTLQENQRLSALSLQAGEIGLVQLLLVNRQLLEGRRDLIDAQTELRLAQISLMQASGMTNSGRAP